MLLVNDYGLNDTLRILSRSLGSFHLYYAKVCLENGLCRFLNLSLFGEAVASIIYYEVKGIVVIYYVAVDKQYRARGFGKVLVASVEELYGDNEVYLASTTLNNASAIRMFNSMGYEAIQIEQLYETYGGDADNVVKLTCGYDDDIILFKNTNAEHLVRFLNSIKHDVNRVWETNCHKPWLKLTGRY